MGPPAAWLANLDPGGVPDSLYGDWENLVLAVRGAMALASENGGDFSVRHALSSKVKHSVAHFHPSREFGDGVDLHLDIEIGNGPAAPDNSDRGDVVLATVEHNLFDETPQQRLALSIRRNRARPDLWETTGEADNFAFQGLAHPDVSDGVRRDLLCERFLSYPDLAQSCFPAPFEFRGDETIIGINLVELSFG
jgi:hypothetical protein